MSLKKQKGGKAHYEIFFLKDGVKGMPTYYHKQIFTLGSLFISTELLSR